MNVVLVYNANSGGKFSARELRLLFRKHKIGIDELIPVTALSAERLRPYIKRKATVAVVGGDGSINTVAGYLVHTKAVLMPLPGGTLNHFTKDLGIPQDFDEALGYFKEAKIKDIDVASVNDKIFINNSSIGIYPLSLRQRDQTALPTKWISAAWAMIKVFWKFRTYQVRVGNKELRTPMVFVGNNRYRLDNLGLANRTRFDEGLLSVFIVRTHSRYHMVKLAILTVLGRPFVSSEFEEKLVTSLTIRPRKPKVNVSFDGEVALMDTPLEYKVHECALRVWWK